MAANSKQTAEVVRIILLFFSYSLFQNISYAKGTIELYRKDVRGMHLVHLGIHSSTDTVGMTILKISCNSRLSNDIVFICSTFLSVYPCTSYHLAP